MANKKRLTDRLLKSNSLLPDDDTNRITVWDKKVNGFGVRVSSTGTISFFVRYRAHGKNRRYTIGKFPQLSLQEARGKALEIKAHAMEGVDPMDVEEKHSYDSFRSLVESFWTDYAEQQLADATLREYRRIIDKHILPEFGEMDPEDITKYHVRSLMNDVVQDASERKCETVDEDCKGHRMANCVKKVLSSIFSNTDQDLDNPCRKVNNLKENGPRKNPLSEDQIRTLWNVLDTEQLVLASYIRILLLTGQRRGETSRMKWDHIEDDIWTIPAEDAKNGERHKVPLSSFAVEILENLKPMTVDSIWVFQSPSSQNDEHINSFSRSTERIREKTGFTKENFRIHDLRSTVRTYLAELGVRKEIADRIQNHSIQGVSDKHYDAYRYVPEKQEALEKWANRLREILDLEAMGDEVKDHTDEKMDRTQSLDDSPLIHVLSQLNGDLKNVVPDPEKRGCSDPVNFNTC
jgi:integrase